MHKQKIRICLKSFEPSLLKISCEKILALTSLTKISIAGPVPLPTKRRIYCVLRSPHVNKNSREHFETREHTRVLDVHEPSVKIIDLLMKVDIPSGVHIHIRL